MFRHIMIKRTFSTFKSKNDEQANQALLGRLRSIPVMSEKKMIIKGDQIEIDSPGNITYKSLIKLIKLHTSDPLIWSPTTLGRIFNLPEDICDILVNYTKPLVSYADSTMDEAKVVLKCPIVIDMARLKVDKNYLTSYKKLAFLEEEKPIERRALE